MSEPDASRPNDPPGGDETFTSVEAIVAEFRGQWRRGLRPSIAAMLPSADELHRRDVLGRLVAVELAERLRAGEPARIEEYLDRFAELGPAAEVPCELIAAEYHARSNRGESVPLDEYARRFPAQITRLRAEVVGTSDAPASGDEPEASIDREPGDLLGDFEIVRLLGAGSYARVYLARQRSLDRLVALKVSGEVGEEGKTLAQLDHPHIVGVFGQETIAGCRVLAMRYVPGRTLADWMQARGDRDGDLDSDLDSNLHTRTWRGRDLLAWLREGSAEVCDDAEAGGRQQFAASPFAAAMCRLVLGLAEALQHAHDRGVLHRDVKPANVLLDLSGRAMLMDFNVSARRSGASGGRQSPLGGTLAYMAPEHLAAMLPEVPGTEIELDGRSDVYSLGVLFYELLAGRHPWPPADTRAAADATIRQVMAARLQGTPHLPQRLRGVSPGLRSIVEKCLAPQPADRYRSAGELAEDLRRWLGNRPLAAAVDPSLRERAAKWVRRHPRAVSVAATTAVVVAALIGYGGSRDVRRFARAETLLTEAATRADLGHSGEAGHFLTAAHGLLSQPNLVLPERFTATRRSTLEDRLAAVATRVAAAELDRFARQADARRAAAFGMAGTNRDLAADPLAVYYVLDRPDWEQLPQFRQLDPQQQASVAEDVTELLLCRAVGIDAEEPGGGAAPAERAKRMLDLLDRVPAARRDTGPVHALREQLRREPRRRIDVGVLAAAADDEFQWYLVAATAARQGEFALALDYLERAMRQRAAGQPPRYWARFLHAYCCERLGQDDAAIADYGICIGLREDFAWAYHNLGLIYTKRGSYALAVENLHEAVRRAPDLAEAHANLGVALVLSGRFADARDALDRAIDLGLQTAEVYSNRAAAREALGNVAGAREDLELALQLDPDCEAAQENLRRLGATQ